MERDRGQCSGKGAADPCNYDPDISKHLTECDVCTKKRPWYDERRGECYAQEVDGRRKCTDSQAKKRSCECYKAICWYFTADFAAAMKVAANSCAAIETGLK